MYGFDLQQAAPRIQVQAAVIDQLSAQVQAVLDRARQIRACSQAMRREVQESARLRRARRESAHVPGRLAWDRGTRAGPDFAASAPEPPMMVLLTRRMRQILELLVQGKSEKEVANNLGLSPHTVHIHVTRMYSRLGVNSRAELLARFYRRGPARNSN